MGKAINLDDGMARLGVAFDAQTGFLSPGGGMLDGTRRENPRLTAEFVQASAALALGGRGGLEKDALRAMRALSAMQRAGGLTDEASCNYDSPPDTGFTCQNLCAALELARRSGPAWEAVRAAIETFLRKAYAGMSRGGHHTPNHRWVLCSALAWIRALLPDLPRADALDAYRAEGIDANADGAFLERSAVVYDSVNDRSLLLLARFDGWPGACGAAVRNLHLAFDLLHPDNTIVTGLSRRYDFGMRTVPLGLLPCVLDAYDQAPDDTLRALANRLWRAMGTDCGLSLSAWVVWALLTRATLPPPVPDAPLPPITKAYEATGLVRHRAGLLSVSAFAGSSGLYDIVYGRATLCALRIQQSYFGPAGHFVADTLRLDGSTIHMHSSGTHLPRRPAYDLPLGAPVGDAVAAWEASEAGRGQIRLPFFEADLTAELFDDRIEFHLKSAGGCPGVMGEIVFDFAAGGVWETPSCAFHPSPNQEILLRAGKGAMRYGADSLEIDGGADAHAAYAMRDGVPIGGAVRVTIPLLSPHDHRFTLRFRRGIMLPN